MPYPARITSDDPATGRSASPRRGCIPLSVRVELRADDGRRRREAGCHVEIHETAEPFAERRFVFPSHAEIEGQRRVDAPVVGDVRVGRAAAQTPCRRCRTRWPRNAERPAEIRDIRSGERSVEAERAARILLPDDVDGLRPEPPPKVKLWPPRVRQSARTRTHGSGSPPGVLTRSKAAMPLENTSAGGPQLTGS